MTEFEAPYSGEDTDGEWVMRQTETGDLSAAYERYWRFVKRNAYNPLGLEVWGYPKDMQDAIEAFIKTNVAEYHDESAEGNGAAWLAEVATERFGLCAPFGGEYDVDIEAAYSMAMVRFRGIAFDAICDYEENVGEPSLVQQLDAWATQYEIDYKGTLGQGWAVDMMAAGQKQFMTLRYDTIKNRVFDTVMRVMDEKYPKMGFIQEAS